MTPGSVIAPMTWLEPPHVGHLLESMVNTRRDRAIQFIGMVRALGADSLSVAGFLATLPAGVSEIRMPYLPTSLLLGAAMLLASLTVLGAWWYVAVVRSGALNPRGPGHDLGHCTNLLDTDALAEHERRA